MKKGILLFCGILILLSGCAAPQIRINGQAAPTYTYNITNPDTQITVWYDCLLRTKSMEGKEKIIVPTYLPNGAEVTIDGKVKDLSIQLRIINEKKAEYYIQEVYSLYFANDDQPYEIKHKLYKGTLSAQSLVVKVPTQSAIRGSYSVEVLHEGKPIFIIGNLSFERRNGESQ